MLGQKVKKIVMPLIFVLSLQTQLSGCGNQLSLSEKQASSKMSSSNFKRVIVVKFGEQEIEVEEKNCTDEIKDSDINIVEEAVMAQATVVTPEPFKNEDINTKIIETKSALELDTVDTISPTTLVVKEGGAYVCNERGKCTKYRAKRVFTSTSKRGTFYKISGKVTKKYGWKEYSKEGWIDEKDVWVRPAKK